MEKPKFIEAHAHILRVNRTNQELDYSSIRTEQELIQAIALCDRNSDFCIYDKPGMWNSKIVYHSR